MRLFASHEEFDAYVGSAEFEAPVDGITLLQEYLRAAAAPHHQGRDRRRRVHLRDHGRHRSWAASSSARPMPARSVTARAGPAPPPSLFALREGFDHPIIGRYLDFARRHGIEIAGFEFIETADGRLVTYDINTNTNYNPGIEAVAPRSAQRAVAAFLGRLLDDEMERAA